METLLLPFSPRFVVLTICAVATGLLLGFILFCAGFLIAWHGWAGAGDAQAPAAWAVIPLLISIGAKAGIGINPATPVSMLVDIIEQIDLLLVMSVNPGFGAQKFIPSTLHKMRRLAEIRSQRGLHYRIEVDGGVGLDTVAAVVQAGAEILVAGNAVFGNGDPSKNAQALLKAATEAALQKV